MANVESHLAAVRKSRGLAAAVLAARVGVSRQTIYAIESGSYLPNTELTLRLARELEVAVEDLFRLPTPPPAPARLTTRILSSRPPAKGQPARLARVGEHWVSIPAEPAAYHLPDADGVIARAAKSTADVSVLFEPAPESRLVLAGCDPSAALLASILSKLAGVDLLPAPASSSLAMDWLGQGLVHVAGSHIDIPADRFPASDWLTVSLARWEQGLVTAAGNPKCIRSVEHLANPEVVIVNRERGSGGRALLDRLLRAAGIPAKRVSGHATEAFGHLAAARAVYTGAVDACIATRGAAQAYGLHFEPLQSERYDLIFRRDSLRLRPMERFLDALQRGEVRRRLELFACYDTSETGRVVG